MSKKPKKSRKGYLPSNHTKERREYIDFDYINKLSDEEKEWLSRFADEEYSASFELNPVFIKFDDLAEEYQDRVKNNTRHWGDYVQVNNNDSTQSNLDMRKMRPYTQYYRTPTGRVSSKEKYRHSDKNINDPSTLNKRSRFNEKVRNMRDDLLGHGLRDTVNTQRDTSNSSNMGKDSNEHHVLDMHGSVPSHEDTMIRDEEIRIGMDIYDKGLVDYDDED